MIGLRNLFPQRSHRQKVFDASSSSLPLVSTEREKSICSFLPSTQHKCEEGQFGDGRQSIFGKIQASTSNLWVLLMMIPFIQKAFDWHAEKQIRVKNLQDQCIQKAYFELREKAMDEGKQLAWEAWEIGERLKTSSISDLEKQRHQDHCIAQKLVVWKLVQESLQLDLNCTEKAYRSMRNEKELNRHLGLPRQPIV